MPGLLNCCPSKGKHESDVNSSSPLSHRPSKALMMSFRQVCPYVPILWETCDLSSLSTLTGYKSGPPPSLTAYSLSQCLCLKVCQEGELWEAFLAVCPWKDMQKKQLSRKLHFIQSTQSQLYRLYVYVYRLWLCFGVLQSCGCTCEHYILVSETWIKAH